MNYPILKLKPGRDTSVGLHHPWIYSGALVRPLPELANGAVVHVADSDDTIIATGTFSSRSMIAVRVFAFAAITIDTPWIRDRIADARDRRALAGIPVESPTAGYRVVYGESDSLPGLVVDRYADILVVQFATAGAELLRQAVIEALTDLFSPAAIYERSDLPSRTEEGLPAASGLLHGTMPESIVFSEDSRRFTADIIAGQKTGFFLDLRDTRREIFNLARGRRVVDLFSYRGASGISALLGGAESVHCVDSSAPALAAVLPEAQLNQADPNQIDTSRITTEQADIFQWLGTRSEPEYDMVLLDPPALIKSHKHSDEGRKGYHFLNRAALRILRDRGILVTSSCSQHFSEDDFRTTLRRAAVQAGVELHLIKMVRQSPDHPIALNFPESYYLKSFICQVRR